MFVFCQDIGDDSNDTDYTPGGPVSVDDFPAKRVNLTRLQVLETTRAEKSKCIIHWKRLKDGFDIELYSWQKTPRW